MNKAYQLSWANKSRNKWNHSCVHSYKRRGSVVQWPPCLRRNLLQKYAQMLVDASLEQGCHYLIVVKFKDLSMTFQVTLDKKIRPCKVAVLQHFCIKNLLTNSIFLLFLEIKKFFAYSTIFKDHDPNSRTFQGLEIFFPNSRTFLDFQGPWQPC